MTQTVIIEFDNDIAEVDVAVSGSTFYAPNASRQMEMASTTFGFPLSAE